MNRRLAPHALLLSFAALPMAWLACGGKTPPPTDESSAASSSSGGGDTTASSTDIPASNTDTSSSSGSSGSSDSSAASSAPSTPPPPPTPALSDTDCGKCVDKTCAKQETACGKDASCKSMLDGVHSCTSGGLQSCLDGATAPTDAKPKKLATAFSKCASGAATKACKTQCK